MEFLKSLKQSAPPSSPRLRKILYNEGLAPAPTRKRGCRGGKKTLHKIKTIVGRRFGHKTLCLFGLRNRDTFESSLIKVKVNHKGPTNYAMLPTLLMANPRSLVNKTDGFQAILMENHVDVAAILETWFTPHMPEDLLGIDGYTLFSKCRTTLRGGGVALYIKESIPSYPLTCISVPDHLECL